MVGHGLCNVSLLLFLFLCLQRHSRQAGMVRTGDVMRDVGDTGRQVWAGLCRIYGPHCVHLGKRQKI